MRIVSLLPSATEMICGLGLEGSLVGVTHECDYPASVKFLPKVTGCFIPSDATSAEIDSLVREQKREEKSLYSLDRERLLELQPDVIVTQTLCNVCAVAEGELQSVLKQIDPRPQVISLEPSRLDEVLQSISLIAEAVGCVDASDYYIQSLRARVRVVSEISQQLEQRPNILMLEWLDPPFSAGHWNPELIKIAGGRSLLGSAGQRSHPVTWERIAESDPDVILIACCGFEVKRTMQDIATIKAQPYWTQLRCVQDGRVYVLDGSAYFNRPGPRLVDSLELLAHTIHPRSYHLPEYLQPAVRIN